MISPSSEGGVHRNEPAGQKQSWVDGLESWIEAAPLPWWLILLVLAAALVLLEAGLLLLTEPERLTSLAAWLQMSLFPLAAAYVLGYLFLLDRRARSAVLRLEPLCRSASDCAPLASEISTMPQWPAVASAAAGLLFFVVLSVAADFSNEVTYAGATAVTRWLRLLEGAAVWMLGGVSAYHSLRQLRIIDRIYTRHVQLDLLNQQPLYRLASVPAATAIGFALPPSAVFLLFPQVAGDAAFFALSLVLLVAGVGTYLAPLYRLHQLLQELKADLLATNARLLVSVMARLHAKVESASLDQVDEVKTAMEALKLSGEILSGARTWPWSPGSLRGTLATLLLPSALWILQWALESWLG